VNRLRAEARAARAARGPSPPSAAASTPAPKRAPPPASAPRGILAKMKQTGPVMPANPRAEALAEAARVAALLPPPPSSAAPAPPPGPAHGEFVAGAKPPPTAVAAPPGRIDLADVRVSGGTSRNEVEWAVRRVLEQVRACAGAPGPGTQADVMLTIDEEGFFVDLKGRGDPKIARCATQSLESGRLRRRPDTGDIQVMVTFRVVTP
jgi:hypothetical protein